MGESTLMSARPPAGLTSRSAVTRETTTATTTPTSATPATCAAPGLITRSPDSLRRRDAAGSNQRFRAIFQNMIDEYSKCNVNWEQPTAPLTDVVDVSGFERDGYNGADPQQPAPVKQAVASDAPY